MSANFGQTIRSLHQRHSTSRWFWGLLFAVLFSAWGSWFTLGQIRIYEISENAKIETSVQARPVAAVATGKIVSNHLQLGQQVEQGELLVQLDHELPQLAAAECQSRIAALRSHLQAIDTEIQSAEAARLAQVASGQSAVKQLQARIEEAVAHYELAVGDAARAKQLIADRAISQAEMERARSAVRSKKSSLRAIELAVAKLQNEHAVKQRDRLARIAELNREQVELNGELQTERATLLRLNRTMEDYRVLAPAAGTIGHVAQHPAGSVIPAGTVLASVVPTSQLRAVGYFPVTSSGRIEPGQSARLKMEGFDWIEFGHLETKVAEVAIESAADLMRVEFCLKPLAEYNVPVQHGLTGVAEVEVETVSPAILVLRRIGALFGGRWPIH